MNILNYEAFKVSSLDEVIEKQKEIMFAFEPDLKKRTEEFDIDIYEDQMLLKDFLLVRAGEELTEAYSAIAADHKEHYLEEIVDVFNFLIEAHILTGFGFMTSYIMHYLNIPNKDDVMKNNLAIYGYSNRENQLDKVGLNIHDVFQAIGECTNLLKQRPWRESQYPVDLLTFKQRWRVIFVRFFSLLHEQDIFWDDLMNIWSRKYLVNKFRIESNY